MWCIYAFKNAWSNKKLIHTISISLHKTDLSNIIPILLLFCTLSIYQAEITSLLVNLWFVTSIQGTFSLFTSLEMQEEWEKYLASIGWLMSQNVLMNSLCPCSTQIFDYSYLIIHINLNFYTSQGESTQSKFISRFVIFWIESFTNVWEYLAHSTWPTCQNIYQITKINSAIWYKVLSGSWLITGNESELLKRQKDNVGISVNFVKATWPDMPTFHPQMTINKVWF